MAIRLCPLVFHYLYENVCYQTSGVQTANEWCMPAVITASRLRDSALAAAIYCKLKCLLLISYITDHYGSLWIIMDEYPIMDQC